MLPFLPIPFFLAAVVVLSVAGAGVPRESPLLLAWLNLLFTTAASFLIAWLAGRSFLLRGTPDLLMLSCGALVLGVSSPLGVVAGILRSRSPSDFANLAVTIHTGSVLLSALCHAAGAIATARRARPLPGPSAWLAATSSLSLASVGTARPGCGSRKRGDGSPCR